MAEKKTALNNQDLIKLLVKAMRGTGQTTEQIASVLKVDRADILDILDGKMSKDAETRITETIGFKNPYAFNVFTNIMRGAHDIRRVECIYNLVFPSALCMHSRNLN